MRHLGRLPVISLTLLLLTSTSVPAQVQLSDLDVEYDKAYIAWDSGRYLHALEIFIGILSAPGSDSYLEKIALMTGELYHVEEVAPDGRSIQISPDGMYAAFETQADNSTVTHVALLRNGIRHLMQFKGSSLVFSPAGEMAAFQTVVETEELRRARQQMEEIDRSADREAYFEKMQEVRWLETSSRKTSVLDLREVVSRRLEERGPIRAEVMFALAHQLADGGLITVDLVFAPDGNTLYAVAGEEGETTRSDIYAFRRSSAGSFGPPVRVTEEEGFKVNPLPAAGGNYLIYTPTSRNPLPQPSSGQTRRLGTRGGFGAAGQFALLNLTSGEVNMFSGANPTVAADGSRLAFLSRNADGNTIEVVTLTAASERGLLVVTTDPLGSIALSPNGELVAYQRTPKDDREIYLVSRGASESTVSGESIRLTREIIHDYNPRFLNNETVMVLTGESRHRRSFLYDVRTLNRTRLFHNNTVRTIAPEYEWDVSTDGTRILICADRDGDTVSPQRGVYLVDLTRKVTRQELLDRLESNLEEERSLRRRGEHMYGPIMDEVRQITEHVSITKVYQYEKALYDFDSKHVTQPGNRLAAEYIYNTLQSFGYEPEYQWFTRAQRGQSIETANVIAALKGTENPELIYVLSSHYDSASRSPGADDNTSGIAVLLEAARVLARHPMPATIVFAAFTGEESGLWGSREFVDRAVEAGDRIVGAINNDMVGWSNDHRLDNTIRYANSGIRDVQHAGSFLFSKLITYDSRYFRGTDAISYYNAYGDIFGGIGGHPIVASPYYHQSTDLLETVNHQLITESCKSAVASMMLLASSPSRINGLELVRRRGSNAEIRWEPSPEAGIVSYTIVYGPADDPLRHETTANEPQATLTEAGPGTVVAVRAVNARGLHGWDWARLTIER